ncbi:MAG: DUF2877 domain-containing protein [Acidipropionibacterium sp.]|jgi:hypothetical protein|nr:DUF2877 domain-containing protein [Acidipropionibacterium sp.]
MTAVLTLVDAVEVSEPVARWAAGTGPGAELTGTLCGVYEHSVSLRCREASGVPLIVNLTAAPVETVCQAQIESSVLAELRLAGIGTPVALRTGGAEVVGTRLPGFPRLAGPATLAPFRAPASWFDTADGRRFGQPRLDRAARAVATDTDPVSGAGQGALHALCGLGIGLTPSGDDALVGLIAAGRVAGVGVGVIGRFTAVLSRPGTENLTTETSLCHLRLATAGDFSPSVLGLLEALIDPERRGLDRAVSRLAQVGHSSGADLMAGVDALARCLAIPASPIPESSPAQSLDQKAER